MPVDASIPLSVKPPQVDSPLEAYGKVVSLGDMIQRRRNMQEQLRGEQLVNDQRERAEAADRALADLYTQHTKQGDDGTQSVDHDAIQQGLAAQGFGDRAIKYGVDARAEKRLLLEDHAKKIENLNKQNKYIGDATGAILQDLTPDQTNPNWAPPDPAAIDSRYRATIANAAKQGIDVSAVPPSLLGRDGTINPDSLAYLRDVNSKAIGASKLMDDHRADANLHLDYLKFKDAHEAGEIKNDSDWLNYASRLFSNATTPERWAQVRQALGGAPPRVLNQFSPTWSPQAQQNALMLTPEQQVQKKQQEATLEETKKFHQRESEHMDVTEQQGEDRLNNADQAKKAQLLSIEARKGTRLKREEDETLKRIKEDGLDQPIKNNPAAEADRQTQLKSIYADLEKRKRQVQDDYENELAGVGIYGAPAAQPAAGQPTATPPAAAPPPPAAAPITAGTVLRNASGHEIKYDPRKNAWVDAKTGAPVK